VWVPDRISNVVLSGAGHVPMWDAPEALAEILVQASGGDAAHLRRPSRLQEELAGEAS
jgi:hypothetical protein